MRIDPSKRTSNKISITPTKPANRKDSKGLPSDPYLCKQIEEVHYIYGVLYPDKRIVFVFLALDEFEGQRDSVSIKPYNKAEPYESPASTRTDSPLHQRMASHHGEAFLWVTISGGKPDANPELSVILRVPRNAKGLIGIERTHLNFQNKIIPIAANCFPVLFEEAKYRYEMRARAQLRKRHGHEPIARERILEQTETSLQDINQRRSILIGVHWLETGGAEKLALDCVQWALDAGLRVLVISERSAPQRLASRLPDHPDVRFVRTDAYLPHELAFDFLAELVRFENVCAIHIHHNIFLYENLARLTDLFPDCKVIDSTHIIEHSNGGYPRTSGVWKNYIDIHHVISYELVGFYLDEFGLSQRVRLGRMLEPTNHANPLAVPELRLQASQKSCRIVFVGRMVHQKRATIMVEITRCLNKWAKREGIDLKVDMVGTGAYRDLVTLMIKRAGLGNVITLHDANVDVSAIMGAADILVAPSGNEGLALVCYEAIENGVIPISTTVGGQRELVAANLLTRNAPFNSVSDTVKLVRRLMTDGDFLESCKKDISARYHDLRRDSTAQEVLGKIYIDILNKAPKAS